MRSTTYGHHWQRIAIIGTGHTAKIRYCALIVSFEVYAAAHVRQLHSAAAHRLRLNAHVGVEVNLGPWDVGNCAR
jgi:hypothetical protein